MQLLQNTDPHSPTFLYALCSKTVKSVHQMCTHARYIAFTQQRITVRKREHGMLNGCETTS